MQKSQKNMLIVAVVGVALVGGLMASGGELFQGLLKKDKNPISLNVNDVQGKVESKSPFKDAPKKLPKIADCSRELIYETENENFDFVVDLWDRLNRDLHGDEQTDCAYQFLAFNDVDRNDGIGYICADGSLNALPREREGDAPSILCSSSGVGVDTSLSLTFGQLNLDIEYKANANRGGNLHQFMNTDKYSVYRVPHNWYIDPSEA